MKRLVVLAMLAAGACAVPPSRNVAWRRTNDQAEPFEQARAACKTYAMERSSRASKPDLAAKAAAGAFAECMRERGWALVDQE